MPKVEDLSNVPASVIKQQKDAEKKIASLVNADTEPTPDKVQNTEPTTQEPVQSPDQIASQAAPVEPVKPAIYDDKNAGQWEHKYNVLQGKYNKEVGEIRSQLVDMQAMVDRQNKIIEDSAASKNNATSNLDLDTGDDLNSEDFSGWGDEMQGMVSKVNKLNAIIRDQSEIINGLKDNGLNSPSAQHGSELLDRVESLEKAKQNRVVSDYVKTLDTDIKGDWRKLNVDPGFLKWLSEEDSMSMVPRSNLLSQAAENLRGAQVASIFNMYINGLQGKTGVVIADELPDGGGQGEDFSEGGKVRVTEADVKNAQQDFIKGRITEEDYDKVYASFQKELRRQQR